jgi:enhancing lycopene biosynthesis protein 2
MVKVGLCLSGCGVFDGSEIHESVIALLALDRAGVEVQCMAPDVSLDVIDHRAQRPTGEKRNALVEAARIARSKIVDIASVRAGELDALIFPGGYGAAKNLCDFESAGAKARPHVQVARLVREMHAAGKPIGAICISPALIGAILRDAGIKATLTVGDDRDASSALEAMGMTHKVCPVDGFCVDAKNRIVSVPAYMYDARISEVAAGIEKLVAEVVRLARTPAVSRK